MPRQPPMVKRLESKVEEDLHFQQANVLEALGEASGGLHFEGPYHFGRANANVWRSTLHREGRLHQVTLKHLRDIGAKYFCWLKPNEIKGSMEVQGVQWPHGAFAYFYSEHEDHCACLFPHTPRVKSKLSFARAQTEYSFDAPELPTESSPS